MTTPPNARRPSALPEPAADFRERLFPGPWLFITLLLILPAVSLTLTPIDQAIAVPGAIVAYVLVAGSLLLMAPTVEVRGEVLVAGRASIPIALLGRVETLDDEGLRAAIGPGLDARAYLMVRGYIHSGVRIDVEDPADPAPYWIITSRKPRTLRAAIEAARSREADTA